MLGENIGNIKGRIVLRRVLPTEAGPGPKVETTFEGQGSLYGIETKEVGTYHAHLRRDGQLYGEGQGMLTGKNGERATWKGSGLGKITKDGGMSFRGAVYYESSDKNWQKLNEHAAVYEHDVDPQGNITSKVWDWR